MSESVESKQPHKSIAGIKPARQLTKRRQFGVSRRGEVEEKRSSFLQGHAGVRREAGAAPGAAQVPIARRSRFAVDLSQVPAVEPVPPAVPNLQKIGNNKVSRWSGHEHRAFGDGAAKKAEAHQEQLEIPIRVAHGSRGGSMSLGQATELSGDFRGSPAELAGSESAQPVENVHYYELASTNVNHFFPLAAAEWRVQHRNALKLANKARQAYAEDGKEAGDRITQKALQTEAFGLHFLQDTYASGHQYPRALNAVEGDWATTALRGLREARTYHDALCALPNGLDLVEGKFHGDDLADGKDTERITKETYNSLAQVLAAIKGISASSIGAEEAPKPNSGPDVGKIMQDPDAAPIWYSLEHSLTEMINHARDNGDGTVTTDSGVTFRVADILSAWEGRRGADAPELSAAPDARTRLVNASLRGQAATGGTTVDWGSDDAIIQALTNEDGRLDVNRVPRNLTVHQTVTLCENLISGACIGNDENAVLFILRRQSEEVFRQAVTRLTPDRIDSGLDGRSWDIFLLVCARRFTAGQNLGASIIARDRNDDAARMLITGGGGERPVDKSRLSGMEWIGVINALLSGVCGDDDEDAIVAIVRHMANTGQAGLVHTAIGEDRMDSGVDWSQWDQVVSIMRGAGYRWG